METKEINKILNNIFTDMRKAGYFAHRNLACCRGCASCEIPKENENLYCYTITQGDTDKFKSCKKEEKRIYDIVSFRIYLYWSAPEGNALELCKIIRKHGVKVNKPTPDKAICLKFN